MKRFSVCLLIFTMIVVGCGSPSNPESKVFATEYGLGPDKWAAAWLLSHVVDPEAELKIVQPGASFPEGATVFDVETAELRRKDGLSAFEVVRRQFALDDPVLTYMGEIVQEVEVEFWKPAELPESPLMEQGFRSLQRTYGREGVSADCYVAFFDRVYRLLQRQEQSGESFSARDLAIDCGAVDFAVANRNRLIPEVPIDLLLREMGKGKRVVFVDVREPNEFKEGHIPGALNVALRDVSPAIAEKIGEADYVVSYCVKDFRGFELAKALHDAGVANSVILDPFGIQGWVEFGLPIVGTRGLTRGDAMLQLEECLQDASACLAAVKE
ncbi:hypothetical protein CAI21_07825 [Alkalilimnicola ehrlichii]|uniref:Rhodanese domain-containing protein n=1 Tax=Alkalilimnicola ehrlichii TaxID=351052 RepID=A0A3E0WZL1_9GAMM|nr:chromate resistance protein ChrB domain-containing protein [Alkalilimnicola ehrlichii]RFA30100.1 hypothetical protein CAI21_07825 [Alkalilimnicola ehrlichii]RFA37445.1 hypothetical protein CAL65_09165 [Alkalilimnicola ehrlichii]